MPSLEEAKKMISKLADELGWGNNREFVDTKLWYAVIELGEAGNVWKHRESIEWLKKHDPPISSKEELDAYITEELIDAIFYILHAANCLNPKLDMDLVFMNKYKVNCKRKRTYVDDSINEVRK